MTDTTTTADPDDARMRAVTENLSSFPRHLGSRIVSYSRDLLVAELTASETLLNRNGVLHGGALMGFADDLGGLATILNLPPNATTTTIESKTNFLSAVKPGEVLRAECRPRHRGRSTMVWETQIKRPDGRVAAFVVQTQMVLYRKPDEGSSA